VYLEDFPGGASEAARSWSLDEGGIAGEPTCTEAGLVSALQRFLNPCLDAQTSLELMINDGRLAAQGEFEKVQALRAVAESTGESNSSSTALAGNTPLGIDKHTIPKADILSVTAPEAENAAIVAPIAIAGPLAKTRMVSTVSAKLSYLIDSIMKHQDEEQIIVFYENDNVAYYLAQILEIVSNSLPRRQEYLLLT
jgi:hypothetical protein